MKNLNAAISLLKPQQLSASGRCAVVNKSAATVILDKAVNDLLVLAVDAGEAYRAASANNYPKVDKVVKRIVKGLNEISPKLSIALWENAKEESIKVPRQNARKVG